MNNKLIVGVVALVVVVAIVSVLLFKSTADAGNVVKTSDESPVKEFVMQSFVEVKDEKYYPQYSLKEIKVNKGDLVRIRVTNTKGSHDFNIDEFNVHSETPLNEGVTIEFKADKIGNFEYYCSRPGHRQNGHWGTLKVQ